MSFFSNPCNHNQGSLCMDLPQAFEELQNINRHTSSLTGALKSRSREGTGFSETSVNTNSCSVSFSSRTFVVDGSAAASPCVQPHSSTLQPHACCCTLPMLSIWDALHMTWAGACLQCEGQLRSIMAQEADCQWNWHRALLGLAWRCRRMLGCLDGICSGGCIV